MKWQEYCLLGIIMHLDLGESLVNNDAVDAIDRLPEAPVMVFDNERPRGFIEQILLILHRFYAKL